MSTSTEKKSQRLTSHALLAVKCALNDVGFYDQRISFVLLLFSFTAIGPIPFNICVLIRILAHIAADTFAHVTNGLSLRTSKRAALAVFISLAGIPDPTASVSPRCHIG